MTLHDRRTAASVVVVLSILAVSTLSAQQTPARVALETWIDRVNNAPAGEIEAYVLDAFSPAFLEQVPARQIAQGTGQLREAGTFALETVESETDDGLVALLHTSSGAWFRVQLRVSGDPPQFDGFLIQPAAEPGDQPPAPLVWETLDELAAGIAEDARLPGVALAWAGWARSPASALRGCAPSTPATLSARAISGTSDRSPSPSRPPPSRPWSRRAS